MARLILATLAIVFPLAALAQTPAQGQEFQEAGVCARCHVISVVEWSVSGHRRAGTSCLSCHGESLGHVKDERNNVKPDRVPHAAEIAALCATCHKPGCPKSGHKAGCQTCHNVHALADPKKPAVASDPHLDEVEARWQQYSRLMEEGDKLVAAGQWDKARSAFQSALRQKPGDPAAARKWKLCERRLKPELAGFETVEKQFDPATGLVRKVRVAELGIAMVLVPGGNFEMGSERLPGSRPVHTVRVNAFYLGEHEVTQAEWKAVMGSNPSAHQGDRYPDAARMPVERVSWEDAQAFVAKLNGKVPGGGFRLPTEAEWECAAKTGGALPEPGDPVTPPGQYSREILNAVLGSPRPVASGHADKLGLYDMLGNVWEWCSSLDRAYPYDAADGRESPAAPGMRILRGGGFADIVDLLDPSLRHAEHPNRQLRWNGLRLARSVPDGR